jgi:hypothetical protein
MYSTLLPPLAFGTLDNALDRGECHHNAEQI